MALAVIDLSWWARAGGFGQADLVGSWFEMVDSGRLGRVRAGGLWQEGLGSCLAGEVYGPGADRWRSRAEGSGCELGNVVELRQAGLGSRLAGVCYEPGADRRRSRAEGSGSELGGEVGVGWRARAGGQGRWART
jgi:hypothetical protein